jgi:Peptidase S24-like
MRKEIDEIIRGLEIDNRFAKDLRQKTFQGCKSEKDARMLLLELEHDEKEDECGKNSAYYDLFKSYAHGVLNEKDASIEAANRAVYDFRKCGNCHNEALIRWYNGLLYIKYGEDHLAIPKLYEAIKLLNRCAETYEDESNYEKKAQCEEDIRKIQQTLKPLETIKALKGLQSPVASVITSFIERFRAYLTYRFYDIGHASLVGKFVFDDAVSGKIEIDRLIIEAKAYLVYNCRSGTEINLISGGDYRWVKVEGESMNRANPVPIEPNDYVLVDVNVTPTYGQIVFASLVNPPTPAQRAGVIKRYSKNGYKSESSMTPIEPIPLADAAIKGVVIAVAKQES